MKFLGLAFLTLLMSTSTFAQDNEVSCTVKMNSDLLFDFVLASPEGKDVVVGQFDGFKVTLHHTANSKFSLEIFDMDGEMRTYAEAPLHQVGDEVANSTWKREVLFETACKIHK